MIDFKKYEILQLNEATSFYEKGTKLSFIRVFQQNKKKAEVRFLHESYSGNDVDLLPLSLLERTPN